MPKTPNLKLETIDISLEADTKYVSDWINDLNGATASNMTIIDGFSSNVLQKNNSALYTPSAPYNPATKIYVDTKTQEATINFETSTNNIKSDGIASVGILNTVPRADHIHQSDPSKASTDVATINSNGLLSSADKTKLDSVSSNSTKTESSTTNGNIKINNIETKVYDDTDFRGYEASGAGYNWIINGNFDFWQRNISQTNLSGYGSDDRWGNVFSNANVTCSQQSFVPGQIEVDGNPTYFSRTSVNSVDPINGRSYKWQGIENVLKFSNSKITLSFWAKADSAKNISVEFSQIFGTGGSTSQFSIGINKILLSNTWNKYIVSVLIPSVSGKIIGNNNFLSVGFWFSAGTSFDSRSGSLGSQNGIFDISQVKVESGDKATPFVSRPYAQELALCQRYYQTGAFFSRLDQITYTGNPLLSYIAFKQNIRAMPTISVKSGNNVLNTATGGDGVDFPSNSATPTNISMTGFVVSNYSESSVNVPSGNRAYFSWTADSEL